MAIRPAKSRSQTKRAVGGIVTAIRAQRIIERLEHYHKLGHSRRPDGSEPSTRQLADQEGVSESTARKAKAFAASFTEEDLEDLLKLKRPDGLPIHWGYIPYILTVPGKTKREKKLRHGLLVSAAKYGWSAPELYQQIKNQLPRPRSYVDGRGIGGRRRKHYDDPLDHAMALLAIVKALQAEIDLLAESLRWDPRKLKAVKNRIQWLLDSLESAMVAANQNHIVPWNDAAPPLMRRTEAIW